MEHYELAKDILEPQPSRMPIITDKNKQRCIRKYGVNEPQAEAILGALDKKRGFTLIQGYAFYFVEQKSCIMASKHIDSNIFPFSCLDLQVLAKQRQFWA